MEFLNQEYYGNPLSAYLIFAATVLGSFIAARIARVIFLHYFAKWAAKTESKWDDVIIEAVAGPATWLVAVGGAAIAKEGIAFSERCELWTHRILTVCAVTILYVALYRLIRGGAALGVEGYLKRSTAHMNEAEKAAEVKTAGRISRQINEIAGMVIVLLAVLTALSNMGVDLKAIWASLGIGGIALALAVKEPLSNFIGRVVIYSTGLFDEGHAIQIDNWAGTVTRIGAFRTSIELISDMSTVTIPNAEFMRKPVKNNYGRKKFIFKWDLDVPYDVDADRLDALVARLRSLVQGKPEVLPEFAFVYVDRLDKYSKVVRVWFQARLPDWPASAQYGTVTLGEVQRIFAEMNIAFAFPTYSVNLEGALPKS